MAETRGLRRTEMAEILGVNPRTILRWQREGMPAKRRGPRTCGALQLAGRGPLAGRAQRGDCARVGAVDDCPGTPGERERRAHRAPEQVGDLEAVGARRCRAGVEPVHRGLPREVSDVAGDVGAAARGRLPGARAGRCHRRAGGGVARVFVRAGRRRRARRGHAAAAGELDVIGRLLAAIRRRRQHSRQRRAARRQRRSRRLDVMIGPRKGGVLRRFRSERELDAFHRELARDRPHRRRRRWIDRYPIDWRIGKP